ncbi:MAG: sigma 54-interacting transcriptional regulator [Desulfobacteraceae bacterium]|jgi:PAS domain S-box-containing protein
MANNNRMSSLQPPNALTKELRQLRKKHQDLSKRLEQLSSLLDHLPGMAFRCLYDQELTFEYASEGSKNILGYDPDKIVNGYTFRQMVHKEDQPHNKQIIAGLTPQNNRYHMTYRMRTAWGEDRWIHEQGSAIFSENGDLVAIEGLLSDITEHKLREIKLHEENVRLRSSIKERYRLGQLIGKSPAIQKVYQRIVKAAETEATVIITGESGTGKELAARAIHELSERKDKPFVAVNCGAIAETLLESEFFGHLRGAFSGAYTTRDGFLKAADGGTLFLDEIGEMPVLFQVKLLRALDGKGFIPVGDNKICASDFRLISATNRDLAQMVRSSLMREDFYYRINTVPILMPPLRERREDLLLLIEHFASLYSQGTGDTIQIPSDVISALIRHHWPGNVRELQNVIRRYLTLNEVSFNPSIDIPPSLPLSTSPTLNPPVGTITAGNGLAKLEKDYISNALYENRWHMGRTAAALGISRRTLQRRVAKYGLKKS